MTSEWVLVGCSEKKQQHQTMARNLYTGERFRLAMEIADLAYGSRALILSAHYGVITPKKRIRPYDVSLKNFSEQRRSRWADAVVHSLDEMHLLAEHFVVLASDEYALPLATRLPKTTLPLAGLSESQQKEYLRAELKHLRTR